ncbi:MAG: type II toxin-antitoxin system prevent-host-death family antitoxin [Chlamydiae bacterium]|nr:type II toxin-antitoxin system prevent-host-death family antitoxin [Chlamydiota bacterium]MBI3277159.1 type II toxin-antitoxin system prevent-host-death family antitoxin [Chlamydiota bacterium]
MTSLSVRTIRGNFSDTLNKVIYQGERIVVKRRGKNVAAFIPMADLDVLKQMEDEIDRKIAKTELKKSKQFVSYESVRKELGLK